MNDLSPILLLILDGWGIGPDGPGNAISLANTPVMDKLLKNFAHTRLKCSGESVGLPQGQMGNSEVGHLNLGAGRIVYQDIMRINQAIADGSIRQNQVLNQLFASIKPGGRLHLMGLLSDGGVHSHQEHLHSLINLAKEKGISQVFIHCFLDGRDTPPASGIIYVQRLKNYLQETGVGEIATIIGRYFAMDRDKRWERIKLAYDALTLGQGKSARDPVLAVKEAYAAKETDEFVKPIVLMAHDKPVATLQDGDGVIFFNFRADRARELCQALFDPEFKEFERKLCPRLYLITMTEYDKEFGLPVIFPPEKLVNILGQVVSGKGMKQLRIAETEKYAHVTYFFNGGEEDPFPGEDRILIPSPREVATYDLKPEMSVYEVTDVLCSKIRAREYDLYVCNFANLDMVGHTGKLPAAIKACEAVDECVGQVVEAMQQTGGTILLTADHGNADDMLDENGNPKTAHSLNPVPFVLIDENKKDVRLRPDGILADVAPTILDLWSIPKPCEMTGKSLLVR